MEKLKRYLLPVGLVLVGGGIGLVLAFTGGWNYVEPVAWGVQMGALATALLRSRLLERKFEASMEQKAFQITLGLREGYLKGAPEHSFAEAEKAYRDWMQARVDVKLRIITGLLDTMTLTFPVRSGEDGFRVTQEPGVMLTGSLSPHYDKGRSDAEITATLNDLAQHLGSALGQVRVYVSFAGRQWTIDVNR